VPRKIRELKADLGRAGFKGRAAKGRPTFWRHPLLPALRVSVLGSDDDDAPPYQERQVRQAIR